MAPPAHSRISRYHRWLTRYPVLVLVAALARWGVGRSWPRAYSCETAFVELLPSNDPGRGDADPHAEADRRHVAAAGRHSLARPRGQPALRRGVDRRSCGRCRPRWSTWRPTTSATCATSSAEQVAVRLGGRPRVDPRPPAQRDQQAQEPALRLARRRGADRHDAEAHRRTTTASTSASRAASSASTSGEYVWIAALPPGRPVRRARGRVAVQRGSTS